MDVAADSHHLDRYTSHDIPQMLRAAMGSATRLNVGPQPHPAGALPHVVEVARYLKQGLLASIFAAGSVIGG